MKRKSDELANFIYKPHFNKHALSQIYSPFEQCMILVVLYKWMLVNYLDENTLFDERNYSKCVNLNFVVC